MVIDIFVILIYVNENQNNAVNLNSVRYEASRIFRNIKKEYMKTKTDELETNSKACTCEWNNVPSGSIKCREFLD
jgi:hypothetical protein